LSPESVNNECQRRKNTKYLCFQDNDRRVKLNRKSQDHSSDIEEDNDLREPIILRHIFQNDSLERVSPRQISNDAKGNKKASNERERTNDQRVKMVLILES
jgi:hypothetical protein